MADPDKPDAQWAVDLIDRWRAEMTEVADREFDWGSGGAREDLERLIAAAFEAQAGKLREERDQWRAWYESEAVAREAAESALAEARELAEQRLAVIGEAHRANIELRDERDEARERAAKAEEALLNFYSPAYIKELLDAK